jgi:hypothetical protein
MSRLFGALAAVVFCIPAATAADALGEGYWRFSQSINGNEATLFLMKIEKKDGKIAASTVEGSSKVDWTVSDTKVDGSNVSLQVSVNQTKYTFEGIADAKDAKVIRGAMFDDSRTFRMVLNSQESDKLEPRGPGAGPKQPEPMIAAQKLTMAVAGLRNKVRASKDPNDKADLQAKVKEAQKEADDKIPELLREVVAKHADSPFAVNAATQLLAGAAKNKAKADEITVWVKLIDEDAAKFGPRIARDTALQTGETLVSQKEAAALALPLAEKVAAGLKDTDALASQSRALKLLAAAQKATGKTDAGTETRLAKVETALDAEYVKKVPPFKPEKFAGRKDKEANRVVVMELFTGAQCPPCVAADVAFDALEKAYDHKDLILIQYHMHIPGPDPLTNLDSIARWDYYREKFPMGVGGTPTTLFNGKVKAGGGGGMANAKGKFDQYKAVIDEALEQKSDIKISGGAKLAGDKVSVDVNVEGLKEANDKLKLRVLLLEESVKYTGGNGLRFHHQVVRNVPDAAAGTAIKEKSLKTTVEIDLVSVKKGLTKYLEEYATERPFPNADRPMDLKHLKAVAIVQDDESGEILNAVQFDVK